MLLISPGNINDMTMAPALIEAAGRFTRLIADKGLGLRHLVEKKQTLEDAFLATVEGAEPGVDRKRRKAQAVGGEDR